jgi:prepilin-type N-terminal cleavage/methylation domain-containing protein
MISRRRVFHKKAFTLLELLLVVTILGVMVAVAAPSFSRNLAGFRVESAAYTLAHWMQYAQEKAVMTGQQQKLALQYDGKGWGYEIEGERRREQIPAGLNVLTAEGDQPPLEFLFERDGSISEADVVIEDPFKDLSKTITTRNGFGRIEIE